jgi:hypothetical protein
MGFFFMSDPSTMWADYTKEQAANTGSSLASSYSSQFALRFSKMKY